MQSGEADCGLFAITFATALSNGLHPGAYIFDQSMMRSHLLHCFENGKIDNFSVRRKRRVNNKMKNSMYIAPVEGQSRRDRSLFNVECAENGSTATLVYRWKKYLKTPK